MASIDITPHDLIVRIRGIDKVLALRTHLSVPLAHVTGVREHAAEAFFDDAVVDSSRGIGTYLRGQVAAGSLQLADGRSFYDVHDPRRAIVVDLEAEPFEHLVVEVDDEPPEVAADRIRDALARRREARGIGPAAEARYRATLTTLPETEYPVAAPEPAPMPGWKRAVATAGAIAFIPVAAIAFVFVAPALVIPFLLFGMPGTGESKPS